MENRETNKTVIILNKAFSLRKEILKKIDDMEKLSLELIELEKEKINRENGKEHNKDG